MTIPEDKLFWLSFADAERPEGKQFLGVIVTREWSLQAAIVRTHMLGINPSGSVMAMEIPKKDEWRVQDAPRDQLLDLAQLEALGLEPIRAEGLG